MHESGATLAHAAERALKDVLVAGRHVESVRGELSKASNFGAGDRPWLEIAPYSLCANNATPAAVTSDALPIHLPYLLALVVWTLEGRDDLATLSHYRPGAAEFSDDGMTLCGAFGKRMEDPGSGRSQLGAVVDRIRQDPTTRRTFVPIVEAEDNVDERLEYPCAAGVQLFLRDGTLEWLTVMRAQQALTVLPYDLSLFSIMHHFIASRLERPAGQYTHFSGTFHIYQNEVDLANRVLQAGIKPIDMPAIPAASSHEIAHELSMIERRLREATNELDETTIRLIERRSSDFAFVDYAKDVLVRYAIDRLGSS